MLGLWPPCPQGKQMQEQCDIRPSNTLSLPGELLAPGCLLQLPGPPRPRGPRSPGLLLSVGTPQGALPLRGGSGAGSRARGLFASGPGLSAEPRGSVRPIQQDAVGLPPKEPGRVGLTMRVAPPDIFSHAVSSGQLLSTLQNPIWGSPPPRSRLSHPGEFITLPRADTAIGPPHVTGSQPPCP